MLDFPLSVICVFVSGSIFSIPYAGFVETSSLGKISLSYFEENDNLIATCAMKFGIDSQGLHNHIVNNLKTFCAGRLLCTLKIGQKRVYNHSLRIPAPTSLKELEVVK